MCGIPGFHSIIKSPASLFSAKISTVGSKRSTNQNRSEFDAYSSSVNPHSMRQDA